MNLILKKEFNQEKVLLELLKNVKVKLIINIMQLNELNKLILKKLKLVYKYLDKGFNLEKNNIFSFGIILL